MDKFTVKCHWIKCNSCGAETDEFKQVGMSTAGPIFYAVCKCGAVYHRSTTLPTNSY